MDAQERLRRKAERDRLAKRIGRRVASWRRARNLTQEVLAEKAEIGPKHVQAIEAGKKCPNVTTLDLLCGALEVPGCALMGNEQLHARMGGFSRRLLAARGGRLPKGPK